MLRKIDLQGSCYIEVQPGRHKEEFWKEESVYFTDDTFFLLSNIIHDIEPSFSLWGRTVIHRDNILLIADNLTALTVFLEGVPSPEKVKEKFRLIHLEEENQFATLFLDADYSEHINVLRSFSEWLTLQSKSHSHITILGI